MPGDAEDAEGGHCAQTTAQEKSPLAATALAKFAFGDQRSFGKKAVKGR